MNRVGQGRGWIRISPKGVTKKAASKEAAQTVEKPLAGFSDKLSQSAARTSCLP